MAKNEDPSSFNGFDVLAQVLTGEPAEGKGDDIIDDNIPYKDPADIDDDDVVVDDDDDKGDGEDDELGDEGEPNGDDEGDEGSGDDGAGEPSGDITPKKKPDDTIDDEAKELEKASVDLIVDRLSEQLGVDLKDEAGDFESMEDVIGYLQEVVAEASTPEYSSDEVKKLDEFIKAGGKFEDYYAIETNRITLEDIDLDNVENQKLVVTQNLKRLGYSDEKIKKAIERYEDAEVLEDEANDAIELLKKHNKEYEDKLLEQQKEYSKQVEQQQQTFIENVNKEIKTLDSIVGLPVNEKDKKMLSDYIFKTDENGVSAFQKNFDIKSLVRAAYFTMKGDKLLVKAKESGKTDAYKKFHQKLKSSKVKRGGSTPPTSREKSFDGIKRISGLLLGE